MSCSNITGLDITNADFGVFYVGRLLKGIGCYLPPPPPHLWSVQLLTLGSLVLKMPALGFFGNKLSMNDDYFSYFHCKGQRVGITKVSSSGALPRQNSTLPKYLEWVTKELIYSCSYAFQRTLKYSFQNPSLATESARSVWLGQWLQKLNVFIWFVSCCSRSQQGNWLIFPLSVWGRWECFMNLVRLKLITLFSLSCLFKLPWKL